MKQVVLVVMNTQALVEQALQATIDKQSFQNKLDLKMIVHYHMVAPKSMENKKSGHIVLHMEVIQCKVDTLDSNPLDQLDIDLMDQIVQYP